MILIGIALNWFTLVDIMDGNRARRLKVGSPLGRLVDEGGDTITMANYCILLAYTWRLNNPLFELLFFSLNFVFYAMEMKYTICGELVMNLDELSPVEIEFLLAILTIAMGLFGD
jgi:phosphatidylglycerophosphate synthase